MNALSATSFLEGSSRDVKSVKLNTIFETISHSKINNNTALIYHGNGKIEKKNFVEVNELSTKLAKHIQHIIASKLNGLVKNRNKIVAIKIEPSNQLIVILLAIWKAGLAYLPLDNEFPEAVVDYILQDAKPLLLVDDQASTISCKNGPIHCSVNDLYNYKISKFFINRNGPPTKKDDTAIVMYTSGSTGKPKGVRLSHKAIWNRLQWQYTTLPYTDSEKICAFKTALVFGDSIAEIWAPLLKGCTLLIVPKELVKYPEKCIELLEMYKVERIVVVPSLLNSILIYLESQGDKTHLENLKLWITSGEILDVVLVRRFFKYFSQATHKICNIYGTTEVTADATYYNINGLNDLENITKVPIGTPIDNTNIYVLNEQLEPVKSQEIGQICISGLNVTGDYVNDSNSNTTIKNPFTTDLTHSRLFLTGDLGKVKNGILIFEGRSDSQIKVRGRKIDLVGIEENIKSINGVKQAVVLCYNPGNINQVIVAFVTTLYPMEGYRIESRLKKSLVWYMVPYVMVLESLPRLVSGKINKQALLNLFDETLKKATTLNYDGVKEEDLKTAKILFETVATVLNNRARSEISIKSNFFEIGGNSLNTVCTVTMLREHGYKIDIEDLIRAKNFGDLLTRMTSKSNDPSELTYFIETLKGDYKDMVTEIIFSSIYHKSDLEQFLMDDITENDYKVFVDAMWRPILEANLSFVIKSLKNNIIGIAICLDARIHLDIEVTSKMRYKFEFLEKIEKPFRDTVLPPGLGSVLKVLFVATHSSVSSAENVTLMYIMEKEILKFAKEKKYKGVFGTNVNKLTQQLAHEYLNYEILLDYQVNKFIASDGTQPFSEAPDDQRAIVVYKDID